MKAWWCLVILAACGSATTGAGGGGGAGGGAAGGAGGGGTKYAPGETCVGEVYCESSTSALFCEGDGGVEFLGGRYDGRFARYACPGALGCVRDGGIATCDVTGTPVGAACPERLRGLGFCAKTELDGGVLRICGDAGWYPVACDKCREMNGQIFCN